MVDRFKPTNILDIPVSDEEVELSDGRPDEAPPDILETSIDSFESGPRIGVLHVPTLNQALSTGTSPVTDHLEDGLSSNGSTPSTWSLTPPGSPPPERNIGTIFDPRSKTRKTAGHATTILDTLSEGADGLDAVVMATGHQTPSTMLGNVVGPLANLSSLPVGGLATAIAVKTGNTQLLVKKRLDFTRQLYEQSLQNHFPDGLPKLPSPEDKTPLRDLLENPNQSGRTEISATEALLHVLHFNIGKLESRSQKLMVKQAGADIALVGAILTGIGSAGVGVGALPGAIVSAAGGVVGAAPDFHAMGRAVYKKFQDTKGVDRGSAAKFLWGLALRKGVKDQIWPQESLSLEAKQAYELADNWDTLRTNEDMDRAQNMAAKLLEGIGVVSLNSSEKTALTRDEFLTPKGFKKIMGRLKSTVET